MGINQEHQSSHQFLCIFILGLHIRIIGPVIFQTLLRVSGQTTSHLTTKLSVGLWRREREITWQISSSHTYNISWSD